MKNLVSIAMATYNGEKYLREQLDSIYNQTYKNIEVIVSDDCSTDKTVEILDEYSKQYGLRYFVNAKNIGYVKNFEIVISICAGDYIALADQDDIWLPEKLEVLLNEIGHNITIHSDAELINKDGEFIKESWTTYYRKSKKSEMLNYIFDNNNVTGCTSLFKKELLSKLLPFPSDFKYHDAWLSLVSCNNGGIKYLDKSLIKYRLHDSNVVGENKNISLQDDDYQVYKNSIFRCNTLLRNSERLNLKKNQIEAIIDIISNSSIRYNSFFNLFALQFTLKYYSYLFTRKNTYFKHIGLAKQFIGNKMINKIK